MIPLVCYAGTKEHKTVYKDHWEIVRDHHGVNQWKYEPEVAYTILDYKEYPLGVCNEEKLRSYRNFTDDEWRWFKEQVNRLNVEWWDFLMRKQAKAKTKGWHHIIVRVPKKLLTISCDSDIYNLVYVGKSNLRYPYLAETYIPWTFFSDYFFIIDFTSHDKNNNILQWEEIRFKNTAMHELLHVFTVPHGLTQETQIMITKGMDPEKGNCDKRREICRILDWDMEHILDSFDYKWIKKKDEMIRGI